jgi:preprotein translocase subunit SecE
VATTTTTKQPGIVTRSTEYIREVRNEMDKVTWPTMAELKTSTTIVLIFLAIFTVITGVMDSVFQRAVILLFSLT